MSALFALALVLSASASAVTIKDITNASRVFTQPDGRSLVVLQREEPTYSPSSCCRAAQVAVRLDSRGRIDRTYGNDGQVELPYKNESFGTPIVPFSIDVDDQGRLVFGKLSSIRRFDLNGRPDMSFGGDGSVETSALPGPPGSHIIDSLKLAPGGRLVIGTRPYFPDSDPELSAISVLDEAGQPDLTFNDGQPVLRSEAVPSADAEESFVGQILVAPDGSIFRGVSGPSYSTDLGFGLLKLESNGVPDPEFGVNGFARIIGPDPGYLWRLPAVSLRSDGTLILSANRYSGNKNVISVARVGTTGQVLLSPSPLDSTVFSGFTQPFLFISSHQNETYLPLAKTGDDSLTIGRLSPEGSTDQTFGT
ncbi:MAG: hypothetical protein QG596_624, partial [Actinomycetota bacterium]|nr:hypothetical protein [Actinomycetota bacterium]